MRPIVLLAATNEAPAYAALFEALAAAGRRAGWLELGPAAGAPPSLEAAAGAGALRAVAAERGRVVSVKRIRAAPVLGDLLREHFRGCLLVLVRGGEGLPALRPEGEDWLVERGPGVPRRRTTAALIADLGRPSLWRRGEEGGARQAPN